jgi:hypothetical protein
MSANLVCVTRCFDNTLLRSYYEGETYSFDGELLARYKGIGLLQHFQTPDGQPAQIVPPKTSKPAPTLDELKEAAVALKEYREKTLAAIKAEADGILEGARTEAARIIDEAVAATKPAPDPSGG